MKTLLCLRLALSMAVLGCAAESELAQANVDAALEGLVPGARVGSTYGEAARVIASLRFEPHSSTSPGGEVPHKRMGFGRYSLRLDLPFYDEAPDSAESVRGVEVWSTTRASADSVLPYLTSTIGSATDTICLEHLGRPGYKIVRWLTASGGVVLETPLREDLNYARLVFFEGEWGAREHHRDERRMECTIAAE